MDARALTEEEFSALRALSRRTGHPARRVVDELKCDFEYANKILRALREKKHVWWQFGHMGRTFKVLKKEG